MTSYYKKPIPRNGGIEQAAAPEGTLPTDLLSDHAEANSGVEQPAGHKGNLSQVPPNAGTMVPSASGRRIHKPEQISIKRDMVAPLPAQCRWKKPFPRNIGVKHAAPTEGALPTDLLSDHFAADSGVEQPAGHDGKLSQPPLV